MPVLRASELVGRVVGGRYRLLRPVGSGASAHVYVAEDVKLKRRTALKVLHPALAQDRSFLRRFQVEAQTVAALRHPGIVRVYDWGEDGDEAFLVMELLEGGSLRALLDSGYRLSISQAAALGLDVAAALAYAHSRGLVHRDIKPANLLFDEEGHASVADFGIARALAEASWTEPVGGLVGTARYAAPEQLRGQPLGGKADVYSLALVLVEAVTGEVPFALDTTIGALFARASTPLAAPGALGPLAGVVEQAGTLDPDERLSAEALGEAIAAIARGLKTPTRLPLPGQAAAPDRDGAAPTQLGAGRAKPSGTGLSILVGDVELVAGNEAVPEQAAAAWAVPGGPAQTVRSGHPAPPPPATGPSPAGPFVAGPSPGPFVTGPAVRRSKRRWLRRTAVVLALALLAGAGAAAAIYLDRPPPPPPTYPVPDLSGDTLTAATTALSEEHLFVSVSAKQWDAAKPKGTVISQYPLPGGRSLAGKRVYVTVSLGPEPVAVPSLATLDIVQAKSFLEADGLKLGKVTRHTSLTVPEGVIISWSDPGLKVLPGTVVNVVVSAGKPMATVPAGADGMPFTQLAPTLKALRLGVSEEQSYNDNVKAGYVISTSPAPGSTEVVGTLVTVDVSLGPHLVTVPGSVVGLSSEQAARVLQGLGLYVSRVVGSPLSPVASTEPPVGTPVLYGSSIVLVTS